MLSLSIRYSRYSSSREPDCPNSVTPTGMTRVFNALPIQASECGCPSTTVTTGAFRGVGRDRVGHEHIQAAAPVHRVVNRALERPVERAWAGYVDDVGEYAFLPERVAGGDRLGYHRAARHDMDHVLIRVVSRSIAPVNEAVGAVQHLLPEPSARLRGLPALSEGPDQLACS